MNKHSNEFWSIFLIAEIISVLVFRFDIYYQLAIGLFLFQFLTLFFELGEGIPLRSLIGTLYALNYLLCPVLMYEWLNPYIEVQYRMKGTPDMYFAYAVPANCLLLLGLYIGAKRRETYINVDKIKAIVNRYPNLPMQLIIFGNLVSVGIRFVPSEIQVLFLGLLNLKFVGVFLHILSGKKLKPFYFIFSYGVLVLQSLISSMFNDLLNMLFFLGIILSIRYKPKTSLKFIGVAVAIAVVGFIQIIKFPLRDSVNNNLSDVTVVDDVVEQSLERSEGKGSVQKISDVVFRLAQGWITSDVLLNYKMHGFTLQDGKHSTIMLKSAVLPRVLAPDKYTVGDGELFSKYTAHLLTSNTSMALGVLADGYIDFGDYGIFIVFLWGLIFNFFIKLYYYWDRTYPLALIIAPACFFYAIRPDTDTHAALGSLIKITFIFWVAMSFLNRYYFGSQESNAINRYY